MKKRFWMFPMFLLLLAVLTGCIGEVDLGSADLKDLQVNGQTIAGFDPTVKTYYAVLPAGTTQIPAVKGTAASKQAQVKNENAYRLPGITTIQVTGSTGKIKTYAVCFTVEGTNAVPASGITLYREAITIPQAEQAVELSRGMACKLVAESFDYVYSGGANPYSDLDSTHQYYEYILACTEAGAVKGYMDGTFKPDDMLHRDSFATLLAKCLGYTSSQYQPQIADLLQDNWAYPFVSLILDTGLMRINDDGTFKPTKNHQTKLAGTIIPIISPLDASIVQVCFSSSNEDVALVNQMGQLTGLAAGTTTITVSSLDGTVTETCTVQVQ